MFRKKKSAPVTIQSRQSQAPAASTTPSASSAAALAFLQKQASDANLSSAAAAAALRSHTTSPVPVGELQTKRMIRRGSMSSHGSPAGSLRQPLSSGVQRRGSSGSMTERTFRSPSPGRQAGVPPVPPIPSEVPPVPERSAARIASPTNASPLAATKAMAAQQQSTPQRTRSINFSRPMSPPLEPRQPAVQPRARPSSSLGFASTAGERVQQQVNSASRQPVSRNTNRMSTPAQGSHLMRGNASKPQSPAGPPAALTAAALAARPAPQPNLHPRSTTPGLAARQVTAAATARSATPMRSQTPTNTTPTKGAIVPPTGNNSRVVSPTQTSGAAARSGRTTPTVSAARVTEQDRIRQAQDAQAKASAMHARPLSDAVAVTTTPPNAAKNLESQKQPVSGVLGSRPMSPSQSKTLPVGRNILQAERAGSPKPSTPAQVKRATSISPNRSAHFSDTPLLDTIKHQPPPRAVSPGKSVLKTSLRADSPADSARQAPSEASDDGNTMARKKKPARVSFEEKPVLVGQAASPTTPDSAILSPQYAKFPVGSLPSDDANSMTPRPALPSFGSIRSRKEHDDGVTALESSTAAQTDVPAESLPASTLDSATDRNLASVVAADVASRTHLETTEMAHGLTTPRAPSDVPAIAVKPPTPRLEEEQITSELSTGAGNEQNDSLRVADDIREHESEDSAEVYSDAAEDLSDFEEPGDADESRGFASLDAILESPAAEAAPVVTSRADSPTAPNIEPSAIGIATTLEEESSKQEDWDMVRAYWSSLSEQKKQEIEAEATPRRDETTPVPSQEPQPNGIEKDGALAVSEPLPPWPDQQYQDLVTSKITATEAPKFGHERAASDTTLTKPVRTNRAMRASTGGFSDAEADDERPQKVARPLVSTPVTTPPTQKATGGVLKKGPQKKPKPILSRTLSNDSSDSDSSFRKRRAARQAAEGGRYSMRKSMRGAAEESPAARPMSPPNASTLRTSMRSPSPTDSVARRNMRSTMRGSIDSTTPSMRSAGGGDSKRSSFLGFRKSSKRPGGSKSAFKSRFGDSSDEDVGRMAFKSRFADSDDEEDDLASPLASPVKLTPVRGIPRKSGQQEGDSTDLSDSDDGVSSPAGVATQTKNEPTTVPPSANGMSPVDGLDKKSKRGLFTFHRKRTSKDESVVNSPVEGQSSMSPSSPVAAGVVAGSSPSTPKQVPQVQKSARSPSAGRSPSRMSFIQRLGGSLPSTPKRERPEEEFPFPPPPIPDEYLKESLGNRPSTSSGAPAGKQDLRPPLGGKRQSTMTAPPGSVKGEKPVVVSSRTGKKKKFQGLRRVFGLND